MNLSSDLLVSKFAFKFDLYRYVEAERLAMAEERGLWGRVAGLHSLPGIARLVTWTTPHRLSSIDVLSAKCKITL
jgi:hypothetical protein